MMSANYINNAGSVVVQYKKLRVRGLGLGTHLFVKVPRPGESEVTFLVFELSCHLLLLV